jgi:hypothetical protein
MVHFIVYTDNFYTDNGYADKVRDNAFAAMSMLEPFLLAMRKD